MITSRQRSIIKTLSKGYRQRVGLAQALIGDPEVLILDEPTIGLDPRQIVEIRTLIKNLGGQRTVILSSHILPEVQMTCSRVLIINNGRLVASDTISGLSAAGGHKVSIRIKNPPPQAMEELGRIRGGARVESRHEPNDAVVFDVFLDPECDIPRWRGELVAMIGQRGWDLVDLMSSAAVPLEETYIRLISSDEVKTGADAEESGQAARAASRADSHESGDDGGNDDGAPE